MKNNLRIAILFTLITTVLFGVIYPLTVNGLAQLLFPSKANGSLLGKDGHVIGAALLGQPFSSPGYFHSRPSRAATCYDAEQSSGSNMRPTNQQRIGRLMADVDRLYTERHRAPNAIALVTTSD